jgi:hypothetical protein
VGRIQMACWDQRCQMWRNSGKLKGLLNCIAGTFSKQKKKDQNKRLERELRVITWGSLLERDWLRARSLGPGMCVFLGAYSNVPGADSAPSPPLGT